MPPAGVQRYELLDELQYVGKEKGVLLRFLQLAWGWWSRRGGGRGVVGDCSWLEFDGLI